MYVGDTDDGSGLHHLLWEVIGNVVDLHLGRLATEVHVDITADGWVSVRDDGPGISVERTQGRDVSDLEAAFTIVFPGGPPNRLQIPHIHLTPSLRGVGLSVVNALSKRCEVETTRAGVRWAMAFERGEVVSPLHSLGATALEGTSIRFCPDPQIFRTVEIDLDHVCEHLQHAAWLSPLLRVFFQGRRMSGRGGLRGWAEQLAGGSPDAVFSIEQNVDDVFVDIALAWRGVGAPNIHSFVNMQPSREHGTHVQGLRRAFAACARSLGVDGKEFTRSIEPGMNALVHVGLYDPRWGKPTRDHLTSPAAGKAVAKVLRKQFVEEKQLREFFTARVGHLMAVPRAE